MKGSTNTRKDHCGSQPLSIDHDSEKDGKKLLSLDYARHACTELATGELAQMGLPPTRFVVAGSTKLWDIGRNT